MIRRLLLEGFVLVERLELELGSGLNALSGGSGEGKTLIVEALRFLSGGPGGKRLVRRGAPAAVVAAWFEVPALALRRGLLAAGVVTKEWAGGAEPLELRRTVDRRGRGVQSANGVVLGAEQARAAGELLVEVFGQGQASRLVDEGRQLELLDACAGSEGAAADYAAARSRALELARERDRLRAEELARRAMGAREENEREALQRLAPDAGEWDALLEREGRIEAADRELAVLARAVDALTEAEETNLDRRLRALIADLSRVGQPGPRVSGTRITEAREALEGALAQVVAGAELLERERDAFQVDQAEAEQVRARSAAYRRVARSVGRAPEALAARWTDLAARPDAAALHRRVRELEGELERALPELERRGARLSEARAAAASRLEEAVKRTLPELGLPAASFAPTLVPIAATAAHGGVAGAVSGCERPGVPTGFAAWEPIAAAEGLVLAREPSPGGRERARFLFAAGPETDPSPLATASGGELSRLFLALGREVAAGGQVPVLVFDEVDQNVGARLGAAVADCLLGMSRGRQVLLVTHLAPVAARAEHHLRVVREEGGSRAVRLEGEARIEELALMIRGAPITEAGREQARELLREAEASRVRLEPQPAAAPLRRKARTGLRGGARARRRVGARR